MTYGGAVFACLLQNYLTLNCANFHVHAITLKIFDLHVGPWNLIQVLLMTQGGAPFVCLSVHCRIIMPLFEEAGVYCFALVGRSVGRSVDNIFVKSITQKVFQVSS